MRVKVSCKKQSIFGYKLFLVVEAELSSTAESDHSFSYSCGEEEQGQGTSETIMPQKVRCTSILIINFSINIDCDYSSTK